METFYNANAAMPSLHFCWTVILSVLFFRTFKGRFRLVGAIYPVVTFFAITMTGNHFILDALAGGALATVAFALVELGMRRRYALDGVWALRAARKLTPSADSVHEGELQRHGRRPAVRPSPTLLRHRPGVTGSDPTGDV